MLEKKSTSLSRRSFLEAAGLIESLSPSDASAAQLKLERATQLNQEAVAKGTVHGTVGLAGFSHTTEGFKVAKDRIFRIALPKGFSPEDIERMQRDFEILAGILQKHPEEIGALLEASMQDNVLEAFRIAQEIGLTEKEFESKGGGIIWQLVGVAVVGTMLLLEGLAE
jgi:hypothetical protein